MFLAGILFLFLVEFHRVFVPFRADFHAPDYRVDCNEQLPFLVSLRGPLVPPSPTIAFKYNYIDDLYSLDPEVYRNLMQLKVSC